MAVLGLRGTGDWAVDERPKSWNEMILYLFPNGDAPLMGLLSKMSTDSVSDPEHSWWEKTLAAMELEVTAFSDPTITIDDSTVGINAFLTPKGTLLFNVATNELMRVTSDPTATNTITVSRNVGGLAGPPTDPVATDVLLICGSAYEEGSQIPTSTGTNPIKTTTFTQILRTSLSMTRTALNTRLRSGESYRNAKIEALQIHSSRYEADIFLSQSSEGTGPDGEILRTMSGVIQLLGGYDTVLPTNVRTVGEFSDNDWVELDSDIFKFGNMEKIAFTGSVPQRELSKMGRQLSQLNIETADKVYGVKLTHLIGIGDLFIHKHPLFVHMGSLLDDDMIVIDLPKLMWRPLANSDTQFVTHRQDPGQDARKDEFLTEGCLQMSHGGQAVHWWLKDFEKFNKTLI